MLIKNTYHNVTVTDMNDLGYGVTRVDGIVVFIDGGVTGDELEIKTIKAAKDYGVARIEKIIAPSSNRVSPDCAVFPRCGGCSFRHISRQYELELKRNIVVSAFRKNGIDAKVGEVLTDGKVSGYRAGYTDTDAGNILGGDVLGAECLANGLNDVRQNVFPLIFCTGRNFPFFQQRTVRLEQAHFYGGSAYVYTKSI
jgi:23S rRNA (uracil1939-C5)-methyltransferase